MIETPSSPNSIGIRNAATIEFPMLASIVEDDRVGGNADLIARQLDRYDDPNNPGKFQSIQGTSMRTFNFDESVGCVKIQLGTDGRPLNARVELLQGPNNSNQSMDIYCENGRTQPFSVVLETPGWGTVVRVTNTGPVEFPIMASVEPGDGSY